MNNPHDRYLTPAYASPKSPYQSPTFAKSAPQTMSRSSSYDPHRVLGYFDLPSRSAPSSPQTSYLPYSPISRGSSPARDSRRSREYNHSHSGSDFEDALVGFSLVPNWLKIAMEQEQPSSKSSTLRTALPPKPTYSPLDSPNSTTTSTPSSDSMPVTSVTPQLNLAIPQTGDLTSSKRRNSKPTRAEDDDDRRYWELEEEDEGYWGEMEQDQEADLEETYRSRR
jgi:hypothetical protein